MTTLEITSRREAFFQVGEIQNHSDLLSFTSRMMTAIKKNVFAKGDVEWITHEMNRVIESKDISPYLVER